jgi:hypothetical protein
MCHADAIDRLKLCAIAKNAGLPKTMELAFTTTAKQFLAYRHFFLGTTNNSNNNSNKNHQPSSSQQQQQQKQRGETSLLWTIAKLLVACLKQPNDDDDEDDDESSSSSDTSECSCDRSADEILDMIRNGNHHHLFHPPSARFLCAADETGDGPRIPPRGMFSRSFVGGQQIATVIIVTQSTLSVSAPRRYIGPPRRGRVQCVDEWSGGWCSGYQSVQYSQSVELYAIVGAKRGGRR